MSFFIAPKPGESICIPDLGSKTLGSPQALWLLGTLVTRRGAPSWELVVLIAKLLLETVKCA